MNIYEEALSAFGENAQLDQTIEECSELIKAIVKYRNRGGSPDDVIEEAVDVHLMVLQLCSMFGEANFERVLGQKSEKLAILVRRFRDGQEV